MLEERQIQIIILLMNHNTWIYGQELADTLNLSTRTIRKDIASINKILNKEWIQSSVKEGYCINPAYIQDAINLINEPNCNIDLEYHRRINVLCKIIFEKEVYVESFEDCLWLAQTATKKELKRIQNYMQDTYHTPVYAKVGDLYTCILKDEEELRKLLFRLAKDEILTYGYDIQVLFNEVSNYANKDKNRPVYLDTVESIRELCQTNLVKLQEEDLHILSICTYICCVRNANSYDIQNKSFICNDLYYDILQLLILEVEGLYEADIKLLYDLFITFKIMSDTKVEVSEFTHLIYDEFCNDVLHKYAIDLRDNNNLSNNLLLHMEFMTRRITNNYELRNPIMRDIKKKYAFAYEVSMLIVQILYKYYRKYVIDDEISYLAVYIEHYFEHLNQTLKVVIVNSQRHSINRVVQKWIEDNFTRQLSVIKVIEKSMLDLIDLKDMDLLIAVKNYVFKQGVESFRLEGLPTNDDVQRLNRMIYTMKMNRRIKRVLEHYIVEEHIEFFDEKISFHQSIQHLASLLMKSEAIEDADTFTKDVIERELNYPTNLCDTFMIPHPLFTFANKTSIAIGILRHPIAYKGSNIQIIFLLAIEKQRNDEMNVIFQFFNQIVNNPKYCINLANSHSFSSFLLNFYDFDSLK